MRDSAPSISVITATGKPMHAVQLVEENPNKNKQNRCWGSGFIVVVVVIIIVVVVVVVVVIIIKPTSVISELLCNTDTSCVSWSVLDFYLYVSKETETSD